MRWVVILLAVICASPAFAELRPEDVKHVKVYSKKGRFGGWPANHGIWIWGNEILVGFSEGWYKDLGPDRHHIDREKPELHWLARSKDGGESWEITDPGKRGYLVPQGGFLHGVAREDVAPKEATQCPGGIDFTHPDFAMTARTTNINDGISRFYYSYDRGDTWQGPHLLPDFGAPGTAARTDYIVNGQHDCMLFLTVAKANSDEGRVYCVRTRDGGKSWSLEGKIGPEPAGFAIMPATVRLGEQGLYTILRRREGAKRWQSAWRSADDGKTWTYVNDPVPDAGEGNPAALVKMTDGRLCMVYGYRAAPFSMRAKISDDNGETWSEDIVLRDDGANRDIGYPRLVQRPDGKLVALYYISEATTGPERYIAATIFDPNSVREQ